jgi:sugar/nucleoside kinase (ribokinase family)
MNSTSTRWRNNFFFCAIVTYRLRRELEPRLILVDSVVVDVVLNVEGLPERGSDTYVDTSTSFAGGGFNVMAAASRLGLPAVYAGVVGLGPFATIAQDAMRDEDIVVAIPPLAGVDTGFVVAIVEPDGERTFLTSSGAESTLTSSQLDGVDIHTNDVVYFSGYALLLPSNARALLALVQRLPPEVVLVFDPSPLVATIDRGALDVIFERVDWLSCNAREATVMTEVSDPIAAAELLVERLVRGSAIVRCGGDGCVVARSGGPTERVEGFPVDVVDSNGAGDTHVGAFAALLTQGRSPLDAARWANAAAALSVTRRGPATGPVMHELEAFIVAHDRS